MEVVEAAFFRVTGAALIVVVAGILAYAVHDLQEAALVPGVRALAFDLSRVPHLGADSLIGTLLKGVFNLSPQYTWLAQDLSNWAAGGKKCLLAYWHEPRFSSGTENGGSANYAQFWSLLQSYGVDVILQGHDHNYERFNPQNSSGTADSTGPISFVVGTGGRDTDTCATTRAPNSAKCVAGTFGNLKLTLHPSSWDYDFESAAGTAVSDLRAGVACHN